MNKGFVFGKFHPFHKGHEAMIAFALTQCTELTVFICCASRENIPGEIRARWIRESFKGNHRVHVRTYAYDEATLSDSSVASEEISRQWSEVFARELPDHTVLITSEPYGEIVARLMNITHIPFDPARTLHPVSASAIRGDWFQNWNHLPAGVKRDVALTVVILGTESTGKTVLTHRLGAHYQCTTVGEAGREIIRDSNHIEYPDLLRIAETHARNLQKARTGNFPLIIADTDIHTTISYTRFALNKELEVTPEQYSANKAELYLYLSREAPFIQDGTRFSEEVRNELDESHRAVLAEHKIVPVEISGSWDDRFHSAIRHIDFLIMQKKRSFMV